MRRLWALFGLGLLAAAITIGGIACGGSDNEGNLSDTPTSIPLETPATPQATTVSTETTPAGTQANTPAGEGATVNVNLTEYIVSPDPASAPAGPVTFVAANIGGTEHALVVIKTDLGPAGLPTKDDGSVDEAGAGIEVIDRIAAFPQSEQRTLTINLASGAYVLICNVVQQNADGTTTSHYTRGMTSGFTVQ